jgi:hypothetical protein
MMRSVKKGLLISLCTFAPLLASVPWAAEQAADRAPNGPEPGSLSNRMDRLEAKLLEVETELAQLQREKRTVQQDLDRQKQEAAALKVQLAKPDAASHSYRPTPTLEEVEDTPSGFNLPAWQWGTRVGFQDFPFRQQQGGFFYSFFVDHRLFSQKEGVPFGDLSAEVSVGMARSGVDRIADFSDVLLEKTQIQYRQTMVSGWIGLKYQLNYLAPYGLRPYVIAGPGMWGDVIESPPFFIGQSLPSKALSNRNLPVVASASIYEGGQGGGGLEFSLARTGLPFIQRVNLGFDYRFAAWVTGDRFATYSFSLSARE